VQFAETLVIFKLL